MTVWILHLPLTPEQEERIAERANLPLPLEELPDLSGMDQAAFRRLLQTMYQDDPPETISRRVERIWPRFSGVQPEDIIAVPLQGRKEMALAEVTGRYHYRVSPEGKDMHLVPVKWYPKRLSFLRLHKFRDMLAPEGDPFYEIGNRDLRIAIRDRLPHQYNRFAKMKWILLFFFATGMYARAHNILMMLLNTLRAIFH